MNRSRWLRLHQRMEIAQARGDTKELDRLTKELEAYAASYYPKLIAALRAIQQNREGQVVHRASLERAEALLRELGEEAPCRA